MSANFFFNFQGNYKTLEFDNNLYTLNLKIIDDDDSPENSLQANSFLSQGCICIYSNHQSLEYVRDSLEKTFLSNLEQEDRLPSHGLPMVLLFAADPDLSIDDVNILREEGQERAKSLQCTFIDVSSLDDRSSWSIDEKALPIALNALLENIQVRMSLTYSCHQSIAGQSITPDLRILLCMFCGDPFNMAKIAGSFLANNVCSQSSPNSLILDLSVSGIARFVEIIFTTYHGAGAYRDELLHGFMLVYSTHRKSSLNTLSAFTKNIPNTPTAVVAVTDNDESSFAGLLSSEVYYSNTDISAQNLEEGSSLSDRIGAHFFTLSSETEMVTEEAFSAFFTDAWGRKPAIEKAFEMDDYEYLPANRTSIPPPIPSRQDSYNIRNEPFDYEQDSEGIYEKPDSCSNSEATNDTPTKVGSLGNINYTASELPLDEVACNKNQESIIVSQSQSDNLSRGKLVDMLLAYCHVTLALLIFCFYFKIQQ